MKCPHCGVAETKVIESRMNQVGDNIRRRRECISCEHRFTTFERMEVAMPMIIKKDGRREPYVREKILGGVTKACQKRPITTEQIERLVDEMEKKVASLNAKEVPSRTIGHLVMAALHSLDKVAYVRFASVYREFRDVDEFVSELREWPPEQEVSVDQEKFKL
jgi:transcriptional repressor NrdR